MQALEDLKQRFNGQQAGTRLELGLLLADVQRQEGQPEAAAALYRQLANESPSDIRPPLALALLKRDEGKVMEVQALLHLVRQSRATDGDTIDLIDQLAVSWGLNAARRHPTESTIPTPRAVADTP